MGENADAVKERWADFSKGDLDYKVRDGKLMGAEFFGDTAEARDALS